MSCAERIIENYSQQRENEILKRIERALLQNSENITETHLQFRLLFRQRKNIKTKNEVIFISRILNLSAEKQDEL